MYNIILQLTGGLPPDLEFMRFFLLFFGYYFVAKLIFFFIDISTMTIKSLFRSQ